MPNTVEPFLNCTAPVGMAEPVAGVTVAVKVTGWPACDGLFEDVSAVVVAVVPVAQVDRVMVLVSMVTAPLRARVRPSTNAPVFAVMDVRARMFPLKPVFVPRVAELPICQKTLQDWAPLIRATLLFEAVVRVEPIWKMKTAFGSPWASRVTVPVRPRLEVDL